MNKKTSKEKLALVLSGGGARGAYEAGVIHYIRTQLPSSVKKRPFDILCGTSVGALNTCFLAATSHSLEFQGQKAYQIWHNLNQNDIYRRGFGSLTRLFWNSFLGILRNLIGLKKNTNKAFDFKSTHFKGLLDTSPFLNFLQNKISWQQIRLNITNGFTQAVSVTTTNVRTGKIELFIDKNDSIFYSGRQIAHIGFLEPKHAMASAAIPMLFPTVRVGGQHYTDGSVRSNTPISPAIHMGADRVLVVGLGIHEGSSQILPTPRGKLETVPTMGEMMGNIMRTVFTDRLEYDLAQLKRINQMIETCEKIYGSDFLEKLNQHQPDPVSTDGVYHEMKKIEVLNISPSAHMGEIFSECVRKEKNFHKNLSFFERTLFKVLDIDIYRGLEFLSYIMFVPTYLEALLDMGYQDAKKRHQELADFFEQKYQKT